MPPLTTNPQQEEIARLTAQLRAAEIQIKALELQRDAALKVAVWGSGRRRLPSADAKDA